MVRLKLQALLTHLLVAAASCKLAAEEDGKECDKEDKAEGDGHDEEEQAGVLLGLLQQGLLRAGEGSRLACQDQPGLLVPLLAAELPRPGGVPPNQPPVHHCCVKVRTHHAFDLGLFCSNCLSWF